MRDERHASRLAAAGLWAENLQLRKRVELVQVERKRGAAQLRERLSTDVRQFRDDRGRWRALATAPRPGCLERVPRRRLLCPARVMPD